MSAPALQLTLKDAPPSAVNEMNARPGAFPSSFRKLLGASQAQSESSRSVRALGLVAPKGLAGVVKMEGPVHAWVTSPSPMIGGQQAARREARRIVGKLVEAPVIVAQPSMIPCEKPVCISPDEKHGGSVIESASGAANVVRHEQSYRRGRQKRESVEIQIEAKDGLDWDLQTDALASEGNVSVWCDKLSIAPS
jgi:hypothetical protein